MATEITEVRDENHSCMEQKEAETIRQIIAYQKSLYLSSLSSSSPSFSSFSPVWPGKSSSLLDLMKEGSTSLGRLIDMEHISLGNYLKEYSVSPIIRPILLWGSDTDNDIHDDPWVELKQIGGAFDSEIDHQDGVLPSHGSFNDGDFMQHSIRLTTCRRKLIRTKSYKTLPRFWRCGRFNY